MFEIKSDPLPGASVRRNAGNWTQNLRVTLLALEPNQWFSVPAEEAKRRASTIAAELSAINFYLGRRLKLRSVNGGPIVIREA